MHLPQLVIYETDGALASALRGLAAQSRWIMREPRHREPCLRLLRRGGPAILVVRLTRDLKNEVALIDFVSRRFPDVQVIVVHEKESQAVIDLAWEFGAACVMPMNDTPLFLIDLVAKLMDAFSHRSLVGSADLEMPQLP